MGEKRVSPRIRPCTESSIDRELMLLPWYLSIQITVEWCRCWCFLGHFWLSVVELQRCVMMDVENRWSRSHACALSDSPKNHSRLGQHKHPPCKCPATIVLWNFPTSCYSRCKEGSVCAQCCGLSGQRHHLPQNRLIHLIWNSNRFVVII